MNFCIEYSQVVLAEITHWNERFTTPWNTERGGSAGPSYAADGGTLLPGASCQPQNQNFTKFLRRALARWITLRKRLDSLRPHVKTPVGPLNESEQQ